MLLVALIVGRLLLSESYAIGATFEAGKNSVDIVKSGVSVVWLFGSNVSREVAFDVPRELMG